LQCFFVVENVTSNAVSVAIGYNGNRLIFEILWNFFYDLFPIKNVADVNSIDSFVSKRSMEEFSVVIMKRFRSNWFEKTKRRHVTYNTRQSVLRKNWIYASFVKSKIPKIFEIVYGIENKIVRMWWIPRGFCILESKLLKVFCNGLGFRGLFNIRMLNSFMTMATFSSWIRINLDLQEITWIFPIVNFQFICSNIQVASIYGVYISQLIWYFRICGSYYDFLDRLLQITRKLLNQEFLVVKVKSSLRKFYARHHDLVGRYGVSCH